MTFYRGKNLHRYFRFSL